MSLLNGSMQRRGKFKCNISYQNKLNSLQFCTVTFRKYSNTLNKKGFVGFIKTKIIKQLVITLI